MRANQLRLWFASFAYVLLDALRRIGLRYTQFASATCGTIRLKLLKIGAQVRRLSVRRIKIAMASACPYQTEYHIAYLYLRRAAPSEHPAYRRSPHPSGGLRAPKFPSHQFLRGAPPQSTPAGRFVHQTAGRATRCEKSGLL